MQIVKKNFVLWLLCEWIVLSYGIKEFRCTNKNNTDTQIVNLQCPPGLVIDVKEALYGRNQWNNCQYLVGDCTETFNVDTQCCGRNDCSLVVRRIYSIKCLAYVSFFRVIYECETADKATCNIDGGHRQTADEVVEPSFVLPPTSPDRILPTSYADDNTKDVYIIVGFAATVAFLMVAIIAVVVLLRKFQWNGEKQCILELFIGLCKRPPPDGCEDPNHSSLSTDKDGLVRSNITEVDTIATITKGCGLIQNVNQPSGIDLKINGRLKSDKNTNVSTNMALYEIIKEVTSNSTKQNHIHIPKPKGRKKDSAGKNVHFEIHPGISNPSTEVTNQKAPEHSDMDPHNPSRMEMTNQTPHKTLEMDPDNNNRTQATNQNAQIEHSEKNTGYIDVTSQNNSPPCQEMDEGIFTDV